MFKKILCPIDFSPGSQQAIKLAVQLANESGAELALAYVWYLPPLAIPGESPFPGDTLQLMIEEDKRGLANAVTGATELGGRAVTSRFVTGTPWERIVDLIAEDPPFDLIVMGSHGRTGLSRILLGSVAEKVVRRAGCSVLVARNRSGAAAPPSRVLCAVDFSDASRGAVDRAAELAARRGEELVLLHVVEVPVTYAGDPPVARFTEELDRRSAHLLEQWAAEARARWSLPVTAMLRIGSPGAQILTIADDDPRYELIVTGSHGRTGLARFVLGSVAEKVVRHAPCSVLVVR